MRRFTLVWLAVFSLSVFMSAGTAEATETISGTIATTKTIYENTRLVGDVRCTMVDGPCIDFGASHIKLWLNGFTMTGPADPDASNPGSATGCNATSGPPLADGIRIANQTNAQILGPGMVQKFRRHGIFIVGTSGINTQVKVKGVTSHHNCFSGIFTNTMSHSVIEGNVSVRNAANSGGTTATANPPCGGNCLVNSHSNRIRKNTFAGNGSIGVGNNDFGVGLLFGSSGNRVEDNTIGGNTNGVLIHADATANTIRGNVIAGNPPSQVSKTFGASIGFDIKDEGVAGSGPRNTIEKNWCITYMGPGPAPCPNFPGGGGDD